MFALDASNLNDVAGKVDEAFVAATTAAMTEVLAPPPYR